MGLKKIILRARIVDLCLFLFCTLFLCSLVFINFFLTSRLSPEKHSSSHVAEPGMAKIEEEILPLAVKSNGNGRRVRRAASASSWTIPADKDPITLGVPWGGCTSPTVLPTEFPNATCFGYCHSGSCSSDLMANLLDESVELVCTAGIIQLGFKRTGTYDISRWMKQHPNIRTVTGNMFITASDSGTTVNFESCPDVQLRDTTTKFHFSAYSIESITTNSLQKNYYLHCEDCLTTALADQYFGTLFLDLPSAMIPYIETDNQKFIVTLKNPTDRAIAEYFYPFIKAGTDLTTVGGEVLHSAMSAAIDQAKECINNLGPTACVYGVASSSAATLTETTILYESCYSTHLSQTFLHIPQSKIHFVKIEEFQADPVTNMKALYQFLGLNYFGPVAGPTGGHVRKPILSKTVQMMDAFFSPFNSELGTLLANNKWLYTRA